MLLVRHKILCVALLLAILVALPLLTPTAMSSTTWPWGEKQEPFPWLDYLANLTTERNVRLVVLTRHEASIQSLTRILFLSSPVAQKLGIIEVQFLYEPAENWPRRISAAAAMGISIDVAWGGGPTLFNVLDEMGYLKPINPKISPEHYAIAYELSKVPETIAGSPVFKVDGQGNIRWIGASVSSFGFTVNKDVLNRYGLPMPSSWDDLGNPVYAKYLPHLSLMGIADPTKSTSNLRIFEIILQAKGWEEGWKTLTLMAANSRIYGGSGDVRDAVMRGDIAIGTTIDFYGYMAMYQNPNCVYIAPAGETIVNADPIAIINITKHPVHAAAFVAWVLSEYGGQLVWFHPDINRIPVNVRTFNIEVPPEYKEKYGIVPRPDLKKAFEDLTTLQGIVFDEELSSNWVNSVMYYFKATLVNAHDALVAAWAQIAKAYVEGRITKGQFLYLVYELAKPLEYTDPITGQKVVFTKEYAISINKKLTDAAVYQALMSTWEAKAREKYEYVLSLLQSGNIPEYVPTTTTATTPVTTVTTPTPTAITTPTLTPITTQQATTPQTTTPPSGTPAPTPAPREGISPLLMTLFVIIVVAVAIVALLLLRRRG